MNKLKLTLFSVLAAGAMSLMAQETATTSDTLSLSLDDCIRIALNENPKIKVADMEIDKVNYGKKELIGQLLPNVSFSFSYSRTLAKQTMYMKGDDGQVRAIQMGRDNTLSPGFSAQMPIIAPQLWKALKLSDNQILQSIETARTSRISMVNQVKNAYYSLLLAYDSYRVLVDRLANAKLNASIYKKRYENGTASEYDMLRSDVEVKNLEPSILEAENMIKKVKLQLQLLMGMDVELSIKPNATLSDYKDTMYERILSTDLSIDGNTDLRMLELRAQALKLSVDREKAAWYPTMALTGGYSWFAMNDGSPFKNLTWSPNSSIGFQISIPLYQGGQRYAKIKQAQIAYKEMDWERENLRRSVEVQKRDQLNSIQKSIKQIDANSANVGRAKKAHNIQEESFKIGASSYLQLVDAEDALLASQLTYYQSIYDYLVAESDLELLLGNAKLDNYIQTNNEENNK